MNNIELNKTWKFNWKLWLPIAVVFVLLVVLGYSMFVKAAHDQITLADNSMIEISATDSKTQVAKNLHKAGLIKSEKVFIIWAETHGQRWRYGIYQVSGPTSAADWTMMFSSGRNLVLKITIPEGWRREQIGRAMESKGITNEIDFETAAVNLEGKLYPTTYYFKPHSNANFVVTAMINEFNDKTSGLNISSADLILASIVERETDHPADEKSIISGIYKNRLAINMKLQADPTGIYANDTLQYSELDSAGQKAYKFWEVMSISELNALNSPYNTYYSSGLPPAPICNPSLETIIATKNYTKSDYFFFQHIKGIFYPAKTYEEHLQNSKLHS